jgi:ADP-ribose pyrophosphatase YjhB (NUDIX family)
MCRRAIAPRAGFWTIPAGYLELDETVAAGAQREAWEEARAEITIDRVLAVYSLPHIGQVQIIHLATLNGPNFAPGEESTEVELFHWHQLPWEELAFASVEWALRQTRVAIDEAPTLPFTSPPGAVP